MPTKSYNLTAGQQEKVFNELPELLRAKGYDVEVSLGPFDDEDDKSCPGCGASGGYGSAGCTCD